MSAMMQRRFCTPLLAVFTFLALPALLVPDAAHAQRHFPADADLELMLRYLVEDGETPGIALGVVDPDGSTRAVAWGSTGPGDDPVGPETLFEIGALTMTFTATLLAEMVERGEVALEDPVAEYLPADVPVPAPGGYVMTLSDLATHQSGLPAGPQDPDPELDVDAFYHRIAEADLERPGRRYELSYLGYALLGHALARAAGVPFDALLRERVLEPLGMQSTGYVGDGEAFRGATGLRSSADDLLRFLAANIRAAASARTADPADPADPDLSTVLERAMRMAHEIRNDRGNPEDGTGYGFSWRTHSVAGQPPIVSHAGGTSETTAQMIFDPGKGIGTVVLAGSREFYDWIGRTLLFFEPASSRPRVDVSADVLRRYTGTYKAGLGNYSAAHEGGHYFIRLEDEGFLTYQPRGRVRTPLYAESDSSFYLIRGPYTVTFNTAGDDVRMVIHVDDREPRAGGAGGAGWRAWKVDEDTPSPAAVAGNAWFWQLWGPGVWAAAVLAGLLVVAAILRPVWRGRLRGVSAA